jgi:hypothetical protein
MPQRKPSPVTGGGGAENKQQAVVSPAPVQAVTEKRGTGTELEVDVIPPQPIKTLHLPFERALMLATLPRKKWDELTWAAFTGAAAALPSAIDAFIHAYHRKPFALEAFETVQLFNFLWVCSLVRVALFLATGADCIRISA